MPSSVLPVPARLQVRRVKRTAPGRRPRRRTVGELSLGLLLGVVGGWVAGLVRVRRP